MKTVIVIPARYASTRYPGKPLVTLTGHDGIAKWLIGRSWNAAMAVKGVDDVFVATDDDRIKQAAEAFGAQVIMTSESCENGTARCPCAICDMVRGAARAPRRVRTASLPREWHGFSMR